MNNEQSNTNQTKAQLQTNRTKEKGQANEINFERKINDMLKEIVTKIEMKLTLEELRVRRTIRLEGYEKKEVIKQMQRDLTKIFENTIEEIQLNLVELERQFEKLDEIKENDLK